MGSEMLSALALSTAGAEFIARFEGFRPDVYICPAGFATIGYGHRIKPTEDIHHLTQGEALDLLMTDAVREARPVARALQAHIHIEQHEADALISLAFNCGGNAISRSTLVRKLNERASLIEVADEFLKWNRSGGKTSKGLTRRRIAERLLFLTGVYE